MLYFSRQNLCPLLHNNISSIRLHCFSSAWVLVYLKVNGMLGLKERRGRKKKKGNRAKKSRDKFWNPNAVLRLIFLCLLSWFSQQPYWHRQIWTACRTKWQEDWRIMCA